VEIHCLFKWVGGKTRVKDHLINWFPLNYKNYYEPFLGGGSIFLAEIQRYTDPDRHYFLSDSNRDLIHVWQQIQSNIEIFIKQLQDIKQKYETGNRKDNYWKFRDKFNQLEKEDSDRGAFFYFLVNTAFNGLARYNRKGHFNSAFGGTPSGKCNKDQNQFLYCESRLRGLQVLLQSPRVTISCCDYQTGLNGIQREDFSFLDPPYCDFEGREIAHLYQNGGFDFVAFAEFCQTCQGNLLVCNHEATFWRERFRLPKWQFEEILLRKDFTSSPVNRRKTREIYMITGHQRRILPTPLDG
jgi:DNA adenine methylase Dam